MKLGRNPYVWQRVAPEIFFGRRDILETMQRDLLRGRSIGLIGGRKMGKTTLLRKLVSDIQLQSSPGLLVLPCYLDTLSIPAPLTQGALYNALASQIDATLSWSSLGDKLRPRMANEALQADRFDFDTFRGRLAALIGEVTKASDARLVIVIDEIEPIAQTEWGMGFFGNWRSLISNTPSISPSLAVVFAGAKEMRALSDDVGSPLANVLSSHYLKPLGWPDIRELVLQPTGGELPPSLAWTLFIVTGGQPFLAQYILHHICEYDLSEADDHLKEAAELFLRSESGQFENWWRRHFSRDERTIYMQLRLSRSRVAISELAAIVGGENVSAALETLMTFGVVRSFSDGQFRANGILFQKWVSDLSQEQQAAAVYDKYIYDRLVVLDPEIARKYAVAWAIYNTDLDNYSGAVSEARDVVTLTLHFLAPDPQVTSQPWYKAELDSYGKELKTPTRRQRVEYIIRNIQPGPGKGFEEQFALFDTLSEHIGKHVVKAYAQASSHTHKLANRLQAWRCLKQLDSVLAQVL